MGRSRGNHMKKGHAEMNYLPPYPQSMKRHPNDLSNLRRMKRRYKGCGKGLKTTKLGDNHCFLQKQVMKTSRLNSLRTTRAQPSSKILLEGRKTIWRWNVLRIEARYSPWSGTFRRRETTFQSIQTTSHVLQSWPESSVFKWGDANSSDSLQ